MIMQGISLKSLKLFFGASLLEKGKDSQGILKGCLYMMGLFGFPYCAVGSMLDGAQQGTPNQNKPVCGARLQSCHSTSGTQYLHSPTMLPRNLVSTHPALCFTTRSTLREKPHPTKETSGLRLEVLDTFWGLGFCSYLVPFGRLIVLLVRILPSPTCRTHTGTKETHCRAQAHPNGRAKSALKLLNPMQVNLKPSTLSPTP